VIAVWMRKNLFRSIPDSIVTILAGSIAGYGLFRFLRFVFITARWEIVKSNLSLFVTGSWPQDELWRLSACVVGLGFLAGVTAGFVSRRQLASPSPPPRMTGGNRIRDLAFRLWPAAATLLLLLLLVTTVGPWILAGSTLVAVIVGRFFGLRIPARAHVAVVVGVLFAGLGAIWVLNAGVTWNNWGGLILNLFLAVVSISLCFPIGVLLALGRRSQYPIVRSLSTAYIELFRGVPLIALLLMANVALGFFVPQSIAPGKVVRAIVVFVLFTAAYVAEIVRGGLQSVPKGQIEAGRAMGLGPVPITTRIVLPQALRNVIPALVGQFISLFKDTVLVGAAMGLTDLLSTAESSTNQSLFRGQGLIAETLVFVLLLFWAGSYTMSRESQRLERRLGVGQR
jgi:general L-amino acid transport system permease protein